MSRHNRKDSNFILKRIEEIFDDKQKKELQDLADSFDGDPDIKIVWDSDSEKFYATER